MPEPHPHTSPNPAEALDFRPFRLGDRPLYEQYRPAGGRVCDHSFANLFAWQEAYGNQWALCGDRLVVRSRPVWSGALSQYMVLPDICSPQLPLILQRILEDAAARPCRLARLSEEEKRFLEERFPDTFLFDNHRDTMDYLYDADAFRTFKGRKLAAKRNHVNRFKSLYDYRYEPLRPDLFGECMRLYRLWRSEQHGRMAMLGQEERVICNFFDCYGELGLTGGALFVGGTLAAFTFGSPLDDHTFDIQVEKADTRFEGVFPMVSQLFAQHLPPQYTVINREEDLGLPGLRQSKLSYQPLRLEPKYTACWLDGDLRGIIRLWREAFNDEEWLIRLFLARYYRPDWTFLRREAERVVAQCLYIPCDSAAGRVGYLYAIATADGWRGRGLAAQVVEEAIAFARAQGMDAVALIPEDDGLKRYYARFGFEPWQFPMRFTSDFDLGTGDPARDIPMVLQLRDIRLPDGEWVCTPEG